MRWRTVLEQINLEDPQRWRRKGGGKVWQGESPEKLPRTEAEEENGPQDKEPFQADAEEEMQPQVEEEAAQTEAEKREKSRWEALLLEAEVIAANLKESGTRR